MADEDLAHFGLALPAGLAAIAGIKVAVFAAAIAPIAGGAYLIWRYWDRVGPWFRQLWGPIERAMERAERFFQRQNAGAARYQPDAQAVLGGRMNAMGAQRIPDSEWNAPEAAAAPARTVDVQGRVVLELAPGLIAREANTNHPGLTIAPNRGATRSRP